ncbi:hypothetical protein XAC301_37810 [Xanthomonas arboricola pv. corylina]|uniref:Uncharacterized protein n=1 Tax=Xanthomonas arboricola pv. corylina TaxID=487821 RepID=A0ABM8SWA2_9XANT|nr:hypothetical protein XAC301_37810 [Xanthomonas arboricola pv. corylina]CAE6837882.1 hypothetical protein XAC301_37810 [Xanthomonas arboricola pv. corylina]
MPKAGSIHVGTDGRNFAHVHLDFVHTQRCFDGKEASFCLFQALSVCDDLSIQFSLFPVQQLNLALQSGVLYDQPLK